MAAIAQPAPSITAESSEREAVFDIFRRWGYLQASLDPLGQFLPPEAVPASRRPTARSPTRPAAIYCGTIGVEFMHIPIAERRQWIQERMEAAAAAAADRPARILDATRPRRSLRAGIQARYLGTKRFSLEGITALIPLLDEILNIRRRATAPSRPCSP